MIRDHHRHLTSFASIENWYGQVSQILESTLNLNRLLETQDYKLFAGSNFGTFNTSTEGFNSPASGGAVFVFEKFDDGWKTVQKIDSPTTANDVPVDRFGHDVSISDDALVVGSPIWTKLLEFTKDLIIIMILMYFDYFGNWIQKVGDSDHIELREAKPRIYSEAETQSISEVLEELLKVFTMSYLLAVNIHSEKHLTSHMEDGFCLLLCKLLMLLTAGLG